MRASLCQLKPHFDVSCASITARCDLLENSVSRYGQSMNIKGKSFFISYWLAPPTITFPAALLAVQGGMLSCSARGTPPIYTTLIRNSTILTNTTNTATIRLYEEGNYTCQAINQYGTEMGELRVSFPSKMCFCLFVFFPGQAYLFCCHEQSLRVTSK